MHNHDRICAGCIVFDELYYAVKKQCEQLWRQRASLADAHRSSEKLDTPRHLALGISVHTSDCFHHV